MNAISPTITAPRLTLTADLGDSISAEFTPEQVTISTSSRNTVALDSEAFAQIVAKSADYDALLSRQPLPISVVASALPVPHDRPALGAPLGGGFYAGPHPTLLNAVLIVAGKKGEATDIRWDAAQEHCTNYRGGGFDDWRAPDRVESLLLWERLSVIKAPVGGFQKDGDDAFYEGAYWTDQEYEFVSGYAWYQSFGDGGSDYWGKYDGCRVRPVRILFI